MKDTSSACVCVSEVWTSKEIAAEGNRCGRSEREREKVQCSDFGRGAT